MSKDLKSILQRWGFTREVKGMKVTRIGRHHFQVESETRPEVTHVVDTSEHMPTCSCESVQLGKSLLCKHARRVGMLAEAGLLPKEKKH